MAFKVASTPVPAPQRGRQASIDIGLMESLNEMIDSASYRQPLVSDETFTSRTDSNKAAAKLARQLEKFRDDDSTRVATRSFVTGKDDPASWNPDDDKWSFGLYLSEPIKRKPK